MKVFVSVWIFNLKYSDMVNIVSGLDSMITNA